MSFKSVMTKGAIVTVLLVLVLMYPDPAKACECTSQPTCTGAVCYCTCHVCADQELKNPCGAAALLEFNASQSELSGFKEQIEVWSGREDLRAVAASATLLYNAVLFQDYQGFIEAQGKLQKEIDALSEEARKEFFQSNPRQDRRK